MDRFFPTKETARIKILANSYKNLSRKLSYMYASIDIGTNTVLLLVAESAPDRINVLYEEQRIPRLGRGVDSFGNLDRDSIERVIEDLIDYRQVLISRFPEVNKVIVTATSAVRDAGNSKEFIKEIEKETGFEVQILSGFAEARFTYSGALSMLPDISHAVVIDIGGGSTEIAIGENKELLDRHSFDMGSVRFTERFLGMDIPTDNKIIQCRNAIRKLLDQRKFSLGLEAENFTLVGVAGTVTSLAYMDRGLDSYDPDKINGYELSHQNLKKWITVISELNSEELVKKYPEVMKGRAEVILAGLLILDEFMHLYKIPKLTVSTGGIRHGSILNFT